MARADPPPKIRRVVEALTLGRERNVLAGAEVLLENAPIQSQEEPELILDELTPQIEAHFELGKSFAPPGLEGRGVRGLQAIVVVVAEDVTAQLVAARLGDDVEHTAQRPAVLGLVGPGLDLHLLDELEAQ